MEIVITAKNFETLKIVVNGEAAIDAKIQKLAFPEDQREMFAFAYGKHKERDGNIDNQGWNFFDAIGEYKRLGLASRKSKFRLTTANCNHEGQFQLSPTYPSFFCVPASLSDSDLVKLVKHRSKGRIPATVYKHPLTGATLSRCAQPMGGLINKRLKEDERLVEAIRTANPTNSDAIYLMDARPYKAAVGNKVMGKGFEDVSRYKGAEIEFLNIDNIHKIRQSYNRVFEAVTALDIRNFHEKVMDSRWIYYIQLIIESAAKIANIMSVKGASVIVHCSDGWDRTAQLTSLVEIIIDPHYRTRKGFAVIVEKEWLSFGHKFAMRHGHGSGKHQDEQRAPIFIQFLDCVWQLVRQFPNEFEYNEEFLLAVAHHSYSCLYGTFLFNSEKERKEASLKVKTESVWTKLCDEHTSSLYANPFYEYSSYQKQKLVVGSSSTNDDSKRRHQHQHQLPHQCHTHLPSTTTTTTATVSLSSSSSSFEQFLLEPDPRLCILWTGYFLRKGPELHITKMHTACRNLRWKCDKLLEMIAMAEEKAAKQLVNNSEWRKQKFDTMHKDPPKHQHTPSSLTTIRIPVSVPIPNKSSPTSSSSPILLLNNFNKNEGTGNSNNNQQPSSSSSSPPPGGDDVPPPPPPPPASRSKRAATYTPLSSSSSAINYSSKPKANITPKQLLPQIQERKGSRMKITPKNRSSRPAAAALADVVTYVVPPPPARVSSSSNNNSICQPTTTTNEFHDDNEEYGDIGGRRGGGRSHRVQSSTTSYHHRYYSQKTTNHLGESYSNHTTEAAASAAVKERRALSSPPPPRPKRRNNPAAPTAQMRTASTATPYYKHEGTASTASAYYKHEGKGEGRNSGQNNNSSIQDSNYNASSSSSYLAQSLSSSSSPLPSAGSLSSQHQQEQKGEEEKQQKNENHTTPSPTMSTATTTTTATASSSSMRNQQQQHQLSRTSVLAAARNWEKKGETGGGLTSTPTATDITMSSSFTSSSTSSSRGGKKSIINKRRLIPKKPKRAPPAIPGINDMNDNDNGEKGGDLTGLKIDALRRKFSPRT